MRTYCFDATAIVFFVTEKATGLGLKKIMSEIESGKNHGILSVVNLAEFHRAITRIFSVDKADMFVIWLKESKIEIISPSIELAILASVKKQKYASAKDPFAWGDAFCLATAIECKADLLITGDLDFEKVKEISVIFV